MVLSIDDHHPWVPQKAHGWDSSSHHPRMQVRTADNVVKHHHDTDDEAWFVETGDRPPPKEPGGMSSMTTKGSGPGSSPSRTWTRSGQGGRVVPLRVPSKPRSEMRNGRPAVSSPAFRQVWDGQSAFFGGTPSGPPVVSFVSSWTGWLADMRRPSSSRWSGVGLGCLEVLRFAGSGLVDTWLGRVKDATACAVQ
ncbi:hypothetical protein C8034_v002305 [Colletotrichum sidae]|uniref:Uncharacterized protein n=1 Tax=Colletotrichum sidae TaxID=1347389 RepID=A0A4R8TCX0_9PEZI|nr:hypothetical protein C8034_v002305 [Colletotrichum sidae]